MEIVAFVRLRLSALRPAGSGRAVERRAGGARKKESRQDLDGLIFTFTFEGIF